MQAWNSRPVADNSPLWSARLFRIGHLDCIRSVPYKPSFTIQFYLPLATNPSRNMKAGSLPLFLSVFMSPLQTTRMNKNKFLSCVVGSSEQNWKWASCLCHSDAKNNTTWKYFKLILETVAVNTISVHFVSIFELTVVTRSCLVEEDCGTLSKVSEQPINGPYGEIALSVINCCLVNACSTLVKALRLSKYLAETSLRSW